LLLGLLPVLLQQRRQLAGSSQLLSRAELVQYTSTIAAGQLPLPLIQGSCQLCNQLSQFIAGIGTGAGTGAGAGI